MIESKERYVNAMRQEGVVVFNDIITANHILSLKNEINRIQSIIMSKINGMERPLDTYTDIAERHLGRLDYRCGFNAAIFYEVAASVNKLIRDLSPTIHFRYYWGAIPAVGGSGPTNMHRDVYPILNSSKNSDLSDYDIHLPPYYFTVLIPLVNITKENGPTQFIIGSHTKAVVNEALEKTHAPLLSPGDLLIFDGRTLHQGLPNQTQDERLIAYITYVANWYHDQTFTVNNYLLPELAVFEHSLP